MTKKIIKISILITAIFISMACASQKPIQTCEITNQNNKVETIITQLQKNQAKLKTCQTKIEYRFIQPLFESQTLRKGILYYEKNITDPNRSKLRITFETLQQDDSNEQPYIEHYIFDGVWLTRIDHQIKNIERRQLTKLNQPINPFSLAGRYLPIIGFSETQELKKQFEITFVEPTEKNETKNFDHLNLKPKPDSIYKDDYTSIDIWIEKNQYLPAKIIAISTEEDIYDIKFTQIKTNKKLPEGVFKVETSDDFSKNVIPLKQ